MRHRKKGKIFGREQGPRKALFRALEASLILYEKIKTTEAKAKALRPLVERLVTRAKVPTLANRRYLLKALPLEMPVRKLIGVLGPRYKERNGGYTRITKLGSRLGDRAKCAIIEFVK
jgi:large subunit ribosomal protein L17